MAEMASLADPRVSWTLMLISFGISFVVLMVGLTSGFGSQPEAILKGVAAAPAIFLAGAAVYFPVKTNRETFKKRYGFRCFGLATFVLALVYFF